MRFTALLFTGCETTFYERGEIAALGAMLAFDSPSDAEKLEQTHTDIVNFLESGEDVTDLFVRRYAIKIAERHERNPIALRIVLKKLLAELSLENGKKRAREFLRGIANTLVSG